MPTSPDNLGHGFIADVITEEHYMLGALSAEVLQPDGDWSPYLPPEELQRKNGLETMNCTVYGTLNCLETLFRRKYKVSDEYSERYVGVEAGTSDGGNSPHIVAETIRKACGLILDTLLPFDETILTWEQYYSPKPMSADLLILGQTFLNGWKLGHEWVFAPGATLTEKQAAMQETLKYSPLGVSVYAWPTPNAGLYEKLGQDNHWTMVYDCVPGKCWKVFDDYDDTHKELAWDYDFGFCKRYSIERIQTATIDVPSGKSWLQICLDGLRALLIRLNLRHI